MAQTSILKTRSFQKTWNTGDSAFIKTKMVFLANASFVRVYKDNVLLTYSTDWDFNDTNGSKIGAVTDLADGVEILSPTNGSVYRVEFDEYLVPFSPTIGICRSDGGMPNKGLPRNTIADNSRSGLLTNIEYDNGTKVYTLTYTKPDTNTFTLSWRCADRAFCCDYDFNVALPTNWRIEVYKIGRHWSGTRASASASEIETMNSIMSPRFVSTTNLFSLDFLFNKKRSGKLKIKMRNTVTNQVSLFSIQTICARQFKYFNRSWAGLGCRFNKVTLK